jgi:hypothetical protein
MSGREEADGFRIRSEVGFEDLAFGEREESKKFFRREGKAPKPDFRELTSPDHGMDGRSDY